MTDSLKVAVFIEENCLPSEGGGYSYYQAMVKHLDAYHFPPEIELYFLLPARIVKNYPFSKGTLIEKRGFADDLAYRLLDLCYRITHRIFPRSSKSLLERLGSLMSRISNSNAVATLKRNQIDVVYYLKPHENPMNFPMMITHWDVGHKSMYPFPEVANRGNYEKRQLYYAEVLDKALVILCESNSGASELAYYYPVNEQKIKVLPLFAGEVAHLKVSESEQQETLQQYGLKAGRFFLYPAQFWAHKNHYNLVRAFEELVRGNDEPDLKLVLCGADQGNMTYIKEVVSALNLDEKVVFTGFISNRGLHTFYRNAIALVMPTFLGPTNLPLIEAAMLHCAVICSDLKGHREIMGDTAIFVNPASSLEIRAAMQERIMAKNNELQKMAFERIEKSSFHIEKSLRLLEQIFLEIRPVRRAWGRLPGALKFITYANIGMFTL